MPRPQDQEACEDFGDPDARARIYDKAPRIELRQLRFFLAVAETLNFTRAAEQMGIAQPPLSQHILALEHQLRVKLFARSRRQVALTKEGEALVDYAKRIIMVTQAASDAVQAVSRGEHGPLALGAIFSSIYTIIPQIIPPFIKRYPKARLDLQEMTISQQLAALREFRIDAGILRGPISDKDIGSILLREEPFVAVVGSAHAFASAKTLALEQIASQPLIRIYPSANRDFSRKMFAALMEKGFALNIVQEVSDTHTLIGLVAAGMGISLVPASFQEIQIRQVRYIPLNEETPSTTLELVWHRENVSSVLKNLLTLVASIAPEIAEAAPR